MGKNRIFYPSYIFVAMTKVLPYLVVTLKVVVISLFFATLIGALLAKAKIKGKFGKKIADLYTTIFRCIPAIVLIFLVYYGIPKFLKTSFGIDINGWAKEIFVIITFSLIFGASLCEIMRAAYLSVDVVQTEAGLSIGLTPFQVFRRIVFPQALRYALPNLANIITALMKEGSIAYTIGLIDMMGQANQTIGVNYGAYALETYIALAIIYWILTKIVEITFERIDKKTAIGRKTIAG